VTRNPRWPVALGIAVTAGAIAAAQLGVAQRNPPDIVIHNAKVITVDKTFSMAEAVAVSGGEIVAVGRNDVVRALAGPRTQVVDLRGRTMMPGFHDTHSHAVQMGLNLPVAMDLTTVTSIADIRKIVAGRVASAKPGEWIFSEGGWWQFMLSDKRLPTRHDLDPVSPRNPVVLRGGHYWIANSAALQQIGYTKNTPDPAGGEIWRDEKGEPTGYLLKTAYRPILPYVPKPDRATQLEGVRQAIARMNSWGMTSYREAGGTRDYVDILRELHGKGQLTIRVDFSYDVDPNTPERDIDAVLKALGPPGQQWGDGMFRADTLAEVFLDGAEESGLLRSGYQGRPEYRGIQLVAQKQLNTFAAAAARHGWRPTPHAVGDAAIDQALEAFEYAHARTPITNRRWMIDHAILLQPDHYDRVKRLGLIVNAQPRHNFIIGDKFIEFWGMRRAQMAYRFRDWLDNGVVLALGADRPISFRASPLMQIDIAVTRRTGWGGVLGADQGISREEAIRAITATPAYTSFEEGTKGSIEPGKYADFVVLSRDILTVPAEDIGRIEVAATMVGGRVVHGSLVQ
jgi:predicted amidohydrolase YtcJ